MTKIKPTVLLFKDKELTGEFCCRLVDRDVAGWSYRPWIRHNGYWRVIILRSVEALDVGLACIDELDLITGRVAVFGPETPVSRSVPEDLNFIWHGAPVGRLFLELLRAREEVWGGEDVLVRHRKGTMSANGEVRR